MCNRKVQEPRLTAEHPVIAEVLAEHGNTDDGTGWHADRPADRLAEAVS